MGRPPSSTLFPYTTLFRSLDDVVARAESAHWAKVITVGLAGVPRVCLGEAEQVGPAAAQVAIPEPQRRAQFRVVPRMAAPVVMPHVARRRVGVHEVAILPEAVPGAVVDLPLIESKHGIKPVFDGFPERSGAVGQAPHAKHASGEDI